MSTVFPVSVTLDEALVVVAGGWRLCLVEVLARVRHTPRYRARNPETPDDPETYSFVGIERIVSVTWEDGSMSGDERELLDRRSPLWSSVEALLESDERWLDSVASGVGR